VHLRLAENLLEMIDGLDGRSFAIGNIAPDSGIPDEKWESFEPPKEVSHVIRPIDDDPFVGEATRRLWQVYQRLWEERIDAKGCLTALDLVQV
jgi:hypothetical protein